MVSTNLIWQSNVSLFQGGLLIVAALTWLYLIYRRLSHRHPNHRLWLLFMPKALVALLLLLLFFDPAWVRTKQVTPELRFLTVIDDSGSMEVIDRNGLPRRARAERIANRLEQRLSEITFDRAFFNHRLVLPEDRSGEDESELKKTDLAQVLMDIERQSAIGMYDGTVLLSDGGDERFEPFRMPSIPHYIVAVGSEPGSQNDIAIHAVNAPVFAETGADIDCSVSLRGYGDADFLRRLGRLRLDLEERAQDGESWMPVGRETVNLREGAAEAIMTIAGMAEEGERSFRIRIEPIDGELTHLNNERHFSIMVEERHWRVLLYARRLGRNISELRRMLAAEPGVELTSLIRLRDEMYAAGTESLESAEPLQSFPESAERLQPFRCLIIGAFPAHEWSDRQMQTVVDFVDDGGSVVFLGGEEAFGRGGYAATPLRPLFPWVIRDDEPEPVIAPLELGLAPAAAEQDMIRGWADTMREAYALQLHSMNRPGRLRAGAVGIVNALHEGERVPVIAFQPYGRGRVMGVATDTMWRWRMAGSESRAAYDRFWSNAIRFLAGQERSGRLLRVDFDRETYHPGERAEIRLRVPGDHPEGRIRVQVEKQFGDQIQTVPLEQRPGAFLSYIGHTLFLERGTYSFPFTVWIDHAPVETFVRQVRVGSSVNEGANIYVDHAFLNTLAARSGRVVTREDNMDPLLDQIAAQLTRIGKRQIEPLVQYRGIYLLVIVILLLSEWIMRRRFNLF